MEIARELPERVRLSPNLIKRATFYIVVRLDGARYFIAATPEVRRLFELDAKGKTDKPDRRRKFDSYSRERALRDILSAIHLQLRDCVLAGIESGVTRSLLDKMREVMAPTVRARVEDAAAARSPKLLKE